MSDQQPTQHGDRAPFVAWLRDQNAGKTHTELTDALHDVVAAVRETGKAGTITFTVKVSPFKGQTDTLVVEDKVTTKIPAHDRKTALWFPDDNNALRRTDPRQARIDFAMED